MTISGPFTQGSSWRTSRSFAEQAIRAAAVRDVFSRRGVRLDPACELAGLIGAAERLAARDESQPIASEAEFLMMIAGSQFDRISDAILLLDVTTSPERELKRLIGDSLDFFNARSPSFAKDAFWEFELWERLTRRHTGVRLAEPDIVVHTAAGALPVACKKIYSSGAIETRLRKGVQQIERHGGGGMVAINLDDLVEPGWVRRHYTAETLGQEMHERILAFYREHERIIDRYFAAGRLAALLFSISRFAEFIDDRPRFANMHQTTVIVSRYAKPEIRARLNELAASMGAEIDNN